MLGSELVDGDKVGLELIDGVVDSPMLNDGDIEGAPDGDIDGITLGVKDGLGVESVAIGELEGRTEGT